MRLALFSAVFLLTAFPVIAADDDASRFNAAYREYSAAIESGDTGLAITSAKAALDIGTTIVDAGDPRLAALMHNYGNALVGGGRIEEGQDALEQSIDMLIESSGKQNPELITYYVSLATASAGFGNGPRQLKWYKHALNVASKNYGKESIEYANLAYDAGTSVFRDSLSPSGEKYLKQSLTIYETELGVTSHEAGFANYQLGRISFYRRNNRKVTRYLLSALSAFGGDTMGEQAQRLMIHTLLVQAYESLNESDNATKHCVAIGRESQFAPNQDHMPLFRLVPQYPSSLLVRGVEGFVDLTFTVDENGFVKNPEVVAASPVRGGGFSGALGPKTERSFEAAALDAVGRFRYAPKFVDGVAVPVEDVKTRISFEIEN